MFRFVKNCFILKRFEMRKQINNSFRSMNDENKNCSHNISTWLHTDHMCLRHRFCHHHLLLQSIDYSVQIKKK